MNLSYVLSSDYKSSIATAAILIQCVNLKLLNLSNNHKVAINTLSSVAKYCKKLKVLTLQDYTSDDFNIGVLDIATQCHDITDLDVSNTNISDGTLCKVLKKLYNIQSLNISACHYVTDDSVLAVAIYCKCIKHLNLHHEKKRGP